MSSSDSAKRALVFVFITVLIDSIGFGIILPVLPEFAETILGWLRGEGGRGTAQWDVD